MAYIDRFLTWGCFILTLLSSHASAQTCQTYTFSTNQAFSSCVDLPVLSSYLHWTYDNSTNTLSLAFRRSALPSSSWTAWAINPSVSGMVGSQAFVAHLQPNGSVKAYTSPVTQYTTTLAQGELSFPVGDVSATYVNGEMTIFASLGLPSNSTTLNQVWQTGPLSNWNPTRHEISGDNVRSMGTLDLLSGRVASTGGADSRVTRKNTHGILNAVSWGLMMPIGVIIARYLKVAKAADPAWFYLHASCQSAAYIIGIAGFATGLKLGNESEGLHYNHHRGIGIALICLATLQVLALFLRPNKDHKHRMKWSIYHHSVGYTVIILSVVNVFKGFGILKPAGEYRRAYVGVVITLAVVFAVLEVFTWVVVIRRRREEEEVEKLGNGGRQPA
uniref:Cytochrome b561 and DOMON domain-containing protein n=1 Tax=Kalanchoe fedtschenkoi TaxID=63787 RepID=A0A7N0UBG8_KALFE